MPKLYFGSRGGSYYRKNGRKVYVNSFGTTTDPNAAHLFFNINRNEIIYIRSINVRGDLYTSVVLGMVPDSDDRLKPNIMFLKFQKTVVDAKSRSSDYIKIPCEYDTFIYKVLGYIASNAYEERYQIKDANTLFADAVGNLNNNLSLD